MKDEQKTELDSLQPPELEQAVFGVLQRLNVCDTALQNEKQTPDQKQQPSQQPKKPETR